MRVQLIRVRAIAAAIALVAASAGLSGCGATAGSCVGQLGYVHRSSHVPGTVNVEVYGKCTVAATATYTIKIDRKVGSSWVQVSDSGSRTAALPAGKDFNLPAVSNAKCVAGATYRARAHVVFTSASKASLGKHDAEGTNTVKSC